jgi:hypothetical protein
MFHVFDYTGCVGAVPVAATVLWLPSSETSIMNALGGMDDFGNDMGTVCARMSCETLDAQLLWLASDDVVSSLFTERFLQSFGAC